jgi:acetyl-CoA acetyltransferase family protein
MELRRVVLVDGVRSAFARGGRGKLVATRLDDAGARILQALLQRNPAIRPTMIQDVGLGNVYGEHTEFWRLGTVSRLAGLPMEVCNFNVNRQCGSSMEALHRLALGIMVGTLDCGIALGIERMGRTIGREAEAPTRVTRPNPRLLRPSRLQRDPAADHGEVFSVTFPDYILDAPPVQSMIQTAQNVAECYGLTRDELDRFAAASQARTLAAYEEGIYADEVIPLEVEDPVFDDEGRWVEERTGKTVVFDRDEGLRPGTTVEKLAALKPVGGVVSYGGRELLITAGNSCPTSDGISAALLASEHLALKLRLDPLARIVGMGVAGVKPQVMGLGPVPATRKALEHAGIRPEQVDRVEFNEAFAAQVIPSIREMGIPPERVNVNGGSIAIGHPLGATGARLVLTVAKELRRSGGRYALATQCIGAGMGIATVIENAS